MQRAIGSHKGEVGMRAIMIAAAGMLMLCVGSAPAIAGNVIYAFDPPPATIAPLSAAALAQAEADGELAAARQSVAAKDGPAATAHYEKAISAGNVVAMVELADLQNHGGDSGVRVDRQRAEELYRQAALAGYAKGQVRFGQIYQFGDGLAEDIERAAAWYRFAADQGDDMANARLALIYLGEGNVAEDDAKAFHFAAQGERADGPQSRSLLAYCYMRGIGVAKDEPRAFHLSLLAAEQGEPNAADRLALMYQQGIGIQKDPSQMRYWGSRALEMLTHAKDFVLFP
jgi:hypothetical protein